MGSFLSKNNFFKIQSIYILSNIQRDECKKSLKNSFLKKEGNFNPEKDCFQKRFFFSKIIFFRRVKRDSLDLKLTSFRSFSEHPSSCWHRGWVKESSLGSTRPRIAWGSTWPRVTRGSSLCDKTEKSQILF